MTGLSRFDFYPRDWISGTRGLSDRAKGIYVDLLCRMYDLGRPLDYDTKDLCRFLGYRDRRQLDTVLTELIEAGKIIVTEDGKLTNDRFKKEIEAANRHIENSRKGGHAKAEKARNKVTKRGQERVLEPILTRSQGPSFEEKQRVSPCAPSPSPSPSKQKKKYSFEGKIIRLTEADFNNWAEAYSHIDIRAVLQAHDDYLANIPPDEVGNWFMRASNKLKSENTKAARQGADADREVEAHAAGRLSSPL